MTVERKLANTLLQKSAQIEVGARKYNQAPPTIATLAEVSALISTCPEVDTESDNILAEVIGKAKDTKVYGRILATLILGVKKPDVIRFFKKDKVKELSAYITYNLRPSEYAAIYAECLKGIEVGDFFQIMRFQNDLRITRPTKETQATPFMPPSRVLSKTSTEQ